MQILVANEHQKSKLGKAGGLQKPHSYVSQNRNKT
jgi:hypothetical protein